MDEQTNVTVPPCAQAGQADADQKARGPQRLSRRSVLKMGVGALSVLALVEFGSAGALYLQSNAAKGKFGGLVTAGLVEDFPPGSVTEFPQAGFFLVRSPSGGFLAVHNRCTHLGCTVYWSAQDDSFFCPCHAAAFDFYGTHEGPPVPRPLDLLTVEISDGEVRVDTAQLTQRDSFEPVQLVYAEVL